MNGAEAVRIGNGSVRAKEIIQDEETETKVLRQKMSRITSWCIAILGVLGATHTAFAQPVVLVEGWELEMVADLDQEFRSRLDSLTVDLATDQRFVLFGRALEDPNLIEQVMLRVDESGAATEIYSTVVSAFAYPASDVAFDPTSQNVLYFSGGIEPVNLRMLTSDGALVDDFELPFVLDAMAVSRSGDIFLGGGPDSNAKNIYLFDPRTGNSSLFVEDVGKIASMDISRDGDLYVQTDFEQERVVIRIDPQGNREVLSDSAGGLVMVTDDNIFFRRNDLGLIDSLFMRPLNGDSAVQFSDNHDILVGSTTGTSGSLLVLDTRNKIWQYRPVPEPCTSILALAATGAMLTWRKRLP